MKKLPQPANAVRSIESPGRDDESILSSRLDRRAFLVKGATAGAALLPIGALLASPEMAGARQASTPISNGDANILRFLAAAELLETDLWQQYTELAMGNPDYKAAMEAIDEDMPDYIEQNTEDEESHAEFLNAFLVSQGKKPVNLDAFRTLPSSQATGAKQIGRLTNLMHLNVDTSWYTRYRSATNPDFGESSPQIVKITDRPGIPLHDGYTSNQIQAIANTGAFHFAMIEQGGTSLYVALARKTGNPTVLNILGGIGGSEVAHFEIWNDQAGNAPPVDSGDGLVFPDLSMNEDFPKEQVMPKPCKFIVADLPLCSVMRPISLKLAGAQAAVKFLTETGLFKGQSQEFFNVMTDLAKKADAGTGLGG